MILAALLVAAVVFAEIATRIVDSRLRAELSLARGACELCGASGSWLAGGSAIGFFLRAGKRACCGARASLRGPIFVVALAVVALAVGWPRQPASTGALLALFESSPVERLTVGLALLVASSGVLAAAAVDGELLIFPNAHVAVALVAAAGASWLGHATPARVALGAAVGFLGVAVPFVWGAKLLRGRAAMGLGDAKVMAVAGALFGAKGAVVALLVGAAFTVAAVQALAVFGIVPELPLAVQREVTLLREAAARGDVEAQKLLAEDPALGQETPVVATGPGWAFAIVVLVACRAFGVSTSWLTP